ncbi:hypothetical protein T01_13862, partial [Trichinella spiralis]
LAVRVIPYARLGVKLHWSNEVAWFLTHKHILHQHGNVWMEDISRLPIEDDRHVHSGA